MKYYYNMTENFNVFWRYGTAVHTVVVTLEMLLVNYREHDTSPEGLEHSKATIPKRFSC
jgi:hypothetical protein